MKAILSLCCFFLSLTAMAQDFPASFLGYWQGELLWYKQGAKEPQKVPMQLIIQPSDSAGQYTWQIIYGENKQDNRPYILKPVDTAKGHWVIDERNSIILDHYWLGNKFTSAFTVGNNTIVDSYWIENGLLMVEFFSISSKPLNTTGGKEKDIPAVDSYALRGYQKAVLKKVEGER
jgi:hypothetical protein